MQYMQTSYYNEKLYGIFVLKEIVVPLGHLNNKYIINN